MKRKWTTAIQSKRKRHVRKKWCIQYENRFMLGQAFFFITNCIEFASMIFHKFQRLYHVRRYVQWNCNKTVHKRSIRVWADSASLGSGQSGGSGLKLHTSQITSRGYKTSWTEVNTNKTEFLPQNNCHVQQTWVDFSLKLC